MRKFKKAAALTMALAMSATMIAGCGSKEEGTTAAPAKQDQNSSSTDTDKKDDKASSGKGSVYMLNFKPETDEVWQDLAKTYKDQTGVDVTVLTAAEGQYSTTLQSEMAKGNDAPTIFNIGNTTAAQTWNDYTYDLKDSDIYNHLSDKSLSINFDGKVAGVANCYEAFGIIYNKKIIADYCKLDNAVVKSADEIDSFEKLKAVAEDINKRVDEMNEKYGYELTEAFASSGLDGGSSWRFSGHLSCIPLYYEFKDAGCDLIAGQGEITGKYLDSFKNMWDLYVSTSAADPKTLTSGTYNAETEFGMEQAVFYQNGNWEYAPLTNEENGYLVQAEDLGMMPIYGGVDDANQGLCVGTENYWAVNSQASEENIQATLDFLSWVITSDEGRDAVTNKMGLSAPFDTFTGEYAPSNAFSQDAQKYMDAGKTSVAWSFNATPNVDDWRADVVTALTAYTEGSGDWAAVQTAFVDGWAKQWKLAEEAAK